MNKIANKPTKLYKKLTKIAIILLKIFLETIENTGKNEINQKNKKIFSKTPKFLTSSGL